MNTPNAPAGASNPAAIIAAAAAVLGLLVLPLVLGGVAVLAGVYGETRATITGWGRGLATAAILLGVVDIAVALAAIGRWS